MYMYIYVKNMSAKWSLIALIFTNNFFDLTIEEYIFEDGKFKVTDKMKEDFDNHGYIMIR